MNEICVLACILFMAGAPAAQTYSSASGATRAASFDSSVMVDYSLSTYDSSLEPGDTGTLVLVLRNNGLYKSENVEVNIADTPYIKIAKKFFMGTIQAGATSTVSLTYRIASDAPMGIQTLSIKLNYDGYDAYGVKQENLVSTYDFPLRVYGSPKISVDQVKFDGVDIGAPFTITLYLKNQNTEAFKTTVTLEGASQLSSAASEASQSSAASSLLQLVSANPSALAGLASTASSLSSAGEKAITILDSNQKYVGTLAQGETVPVTFRAYISEKAVSGAYSLPLTIQYENKGKVAQSEELEIGVFVTGKPQVSFSNVKTDPSEIHQDEKDVEVKVTVENIGTKEVDNFRMTLQPDGPFRNARSYVQTQELGTVKTQDSSIVSFYVDVDKGAKPGLYPLAFLAEYKLGIKYVNETKFIQIALKDSPDFTVTSPTISVVAGEKGRIQAKVTNNGKKCESVTLWVMKKSDQPFEFDDKSQYIGDLDVGEGGEAALTFTTDAAAKEQDYIVPMEIRCTLDDKVEVYSASTRITVTAASQLDSVPTALVAAVVLALALALWGAKNYVKGGRGKEKPESRRKDEKQGQ